MNILWITNTIFPEPSKRLGLPEPVVGGWMFGLSRQLANTGNRLSIATVYSGKDVKVLEIDSVKYYLLPVKEGKIIDHRLEELWSVVCKETNPGIIHIHGTEYSHGLSCIHSRPNENYVISIQGMVGVIYKYYMGGLSNNDIIRNITIRDIIRKNTLFQGRKHCYLRGINEKEYFLRTKHVIGRTQWDYVHSKIINPKIKYHFCNESLRDSFYTAKKWSLNKDNYTIFLSQSEYPLKGLHQVLRAVALIRKEFPGLKVRIAGHNILRENVWKDKLKINGYGNYIAKLIKKNNLSKQIQFTGPLTETRMIEEYRNSRLFICPSSIENSPNSLGEAQILGVPVIAAYVGGIPDMVENNRTGLLYQYEEVEMLAENIHRIFSDDSLALCLSEQEIRSAEERHNRKVNLDKLLQIYEQVIREN